jgi:hypothetical protein
MRANGVGANALKLDSEWFQPVVVRLVVELRRWYALYGLKSTVL